MGLLEVFGPPGLWPDEDLVAFSDLFDPGLVLAAYRSGVFPMPLRESYFAGRMAWWSPVQRGVIEPEQLHVTRSLRRSARRFTLTADRAFPAVIAACADPRRPGGWIDDDITAVYTELHAAGWAHSVEAWTAEGELAGGLYGISLGGLFAGESMFHRTDTGRDASKAALAGLARFLVRDGVTRLIDVQWLTPHLESLGAYEIPRAAYLARLDGLLRAPAPDWASFSQPPGNGPFITGN
jgi:leucyl/phenylalanyl-tRNA--protein transferase